MNIQPIDLKTARAFVGTFHRHHKAPQGGLFAIGVNDGSELIGVVIVGRPVSRVLAADKTTAEITRCCVRDGFPNAASMLMGAAARAAKAMGYHKLITYILADETGASLKAAGFVAVADVRGKSWSVPSRKRTDKHPLVNKVRFERVLTSDPSPVCSWQAPAAIEQMELLTA